MKKQISKKTLNVVNMSLFEGQIELILESLELYAFNSRYVLNTNNMGSNIDKLVTTYEQVANILARSKNNKTLEITNDNIRYLKMKREEELKKSV